jgi:membrane associated rhomboid family serine protease
MATCYRHPNRETGVSCSNCGRPICPDCMTATPVGMRCPECSRQTTAVRTMRNMYADPIATYVLIGINVLMYIGLVASGGGGGRVYQDLVTLSFASTQTGDLIGVSQGELWRLVTGGFLHSPSNPIHILFNMYALYWLGTMLEPLLGHVRFLALYFAALLAGSFGALVTAAEPFQGTVGASGAVFGLMAAAFVFQRSRGIDPMRSGLGFVMGFNLVLTFLIPGISIGGHIGGIIGGGVAALAMDRLGSVRRGVLLPVLACVAVGAISVVGAVMVANAGAADLGF